MSDVVGLDTAKVELLEQAVRRGAEHLDRLIPAVNRALVEGELDPVVARPVVEVGHWLDAQSVRLRIIVETVLRWDTLAARVPGLGPQLWNHPEHPSYRAPARAWAAAMAAVAAMAAGDDEQLLELIRTWAGDPVFAGIVGPRIDAGLLVEQLVLLDGLLAYPAGTAQRLDQETVVRSLAATLAAMSIVGTGAVDFAGLARLLDERGASPRPLALLFRQPLDWHADTLVAAVDHIVLPLNREMLSGAAVERAYIADGNDLTDARVLVLRALARDGLAAIEVLRDVDLDQLAAAGVAYLDGGAALGEALAAASVAAVREPAPILRFIEWVGPDKALAPGLLDHLGVIAAPHLGAFRPDRLEHASGADHVVNTIPGLGEADAREYLDAAARSRRSIDDLRIALVGWVGLQLDVLYAAGAAPLGALQQVGAIYRFISDGGRRFDELRARALDASTERTERGLEIVSNVATSFLPKPWGGLVGSAGVEVLVSHKWPTTNAEQEHLERVALDVRDSQQELEWHVLDRAWRHRDQNGLFVNAPAPPSELLTDEGTLRPYVDLTEADRERFRLWRDDPSLQDAVRFNDASASFGR